MVTSQALARAQLSAELVELVSGAGELAVYGREQQWAQRIEMADAKLAATERPGAWISGVTSGMGVAIGGVAMVAVAAIVVQATADGRLDGVGKVEPGLGEDDDADGGAAVIRDHADVGRVVEEPSRQAELARLLIDMR